MKAALFGIAGLCLSAAFAIHMSGSADALFANLFSLGGGRGEPFDFSRPSIVSSPSSSRAVLSKKSPPRCGTPVRSPAFRTAIVINEVAWMGSGGDAKREWIELRNQTARTADISGWELRDKSGSLSARMPEGTVIGPGSFIIAARGTGTYEGFSPRIRFSGTVNDADESIALIGASCGIEDEVVASPRWPAGDTSGRTAERGVDAAWHSSANPGGTPGSENSDAPAASLAIRTLPQASVSSGASAPQESSLVPLLSACVYIREIHPGDAGDSDFEFVELYNDSDAAAPLDGWSIKKRSSTGSLSSFIAKSRLSGKMIPPHGHFLIANEKGYAGSPAPDAVWPGSYTLAQSKNALLLFNEAGEAAHECAWIEIAPGMSAACGAAGGNAHEVQPSPEGGARG